ncbi:MAG: hypothetical protein NTU58_02355 [Candidatus Nealsonbacteria bacterium]|nr:hypothetical protein [Candidatus Nealsonbacteria bacterium]
MVNQKMKKYIIPILIVSLIGIFGGTCQVLAGFGVSPPFINNNHLRPGSNFEETIYLVRGQPTEDLIAEINIDAPEIEKWITIEKGLRFLLPKDVQQFPMKVIINIPDDAAYGNYQGYIRVRVIPSGSSTGGQVTNLLGGRIDVGLTVSEEGFSDFRLKGLSIPDFEKGDPLVCLMVLINTGNIKTKPTKVHFDIYNTAHTQIIKSGDIFDMDFVEAFQESQIQGTLPINLEIGEYWADVTLYKEEVPLDAYKVYFKVVPEGTLNKEVEKTKGLSTIDYKLGGITIVMVLVMLAWINKDKIKTVFKRK